MRLRFIFVGLALILTILLVLMTLNVDWSTWRPATCWPDACFCEVIGTGSIRQPINTWSNLAFIMAGLVVAADRSWRRTDRLILASACVAIGLGSMFYHASLSFVGQWFDVMSMYLLGTFMVLYAARRMNAARSFPRAFAKRVAGTLCRVRRSGNPVSRSAPIANLYSGWPIRPVREAGARRAEAFGHDRIERTFAIWYVTLNVALGVLLIVWPEARRYVFGGLIGVALVLETILQRKGQTTAKPQWLIAAVAAYLIAQVIWTLDLNRIVCDPTSVLQGHAVWHVLTALSAGLVYGYYRSETRNGHRLKSTAGVGKPA